MEIADFATNATRRSSDEQIAVEIESLFLECVHRPTRYARGKLAQEHVKNASKWSDRVESIVNSRLPEFYKLADQAAAAARRVQHHLKSEKYSRRYKAALMASLICICDMERYMYRYERAHLAAQFCQCLQPDAALIQEKIALLCWNRERSDDDLTPMFHFLAYLGSSAPVSLSKASIVVKFVSYVQKRVSGRHESRSGPREAKSDFAKSYIIMAWTLLDETIPLLEVQQLVHDETLWTDFSSALMTQTQDSGSLSERDLFHIIGIAMFVRHRLSPLGDPNGALNSLRAEQADHMILYLVQTLARKSEHELLSIIMGMRNRKKNRQRSMQKKRKASTASKLAPPSTSADMSGAEIFSSAFQRLEKPRTLSALSILSHFWSKSLVIPPSCNLERFKSVLNQVEAVINAMDRLAEAPDITDIFARVTTSVMESTTHTLPAMSEDIAFANFPPCKLRQILRRVNIQRLPLHEILTSPADGCVSRALECLQKMPYEASMRQLASKHLEAYARAIFSQVHYDMGRNRNLNVEGACALIGVALRRHRIDRIRRKLIEYGGGRIARYQKLNSSSENHEANAVMTPLIPQTDENTPPEEAQKNSQQNASAEQTNEYSQIAHRKRNRAELFLSQAFQAGAEQSKDSSPRKRICLEQSPTKMRSRFVSRCREQISSPLALSQNTSDAAQDHGKRTDNSHSPKYSEISLMEAVRAVLYSRIDRDRFKERCRSGALWWREKLSPHTADNNIFLTSESSSSSVL